MPVIGRTTESLNARIEKDALAQLREWARPSGAVGRVISRLVWQEVARQQEREKVKDVLASAQGNRIRIFLYLCGSADSG